MLNNSLKLCLILILFLNFLSGAVTDRGFLESYTVDAFEPCGEGMPDSVVAFMLDIINQGSGS
jgi:hypothetical protein